MQFQPGNQFWKLRSKHGRDTIFTDPEKLWEAACEYFEATDNRKWSKKDWVGKDAKPVERDSETPYTLSGLCLFLHANRGYWSEFKQSQRAKEIGFSEVITRIEEIIYTQKFEGATVGAFNANIIARDLGLREQIDQSVTDTRKTTSDLFPDQLKAE